MQLGPRSFLRMGTRVVPLLRNGTLFYLPVSIGRTWTSGQIEMLSREMPAVESINVAPVESSSRSWCMV